MVVNSSELWATDFPLTEVSPLHLDVVAHGGRRAQWERFRVSVTVRLYSPWKTIMTSGQDVSEYLDTLGLVKSYFFKFFEKFPDVTLSLIRFGNWQIQQGLDWMFGPHTQRDNPLFRIVLLEFFFPSLVKKRNEENEVGEFTNYQTCW
jgi:hypothetical protein